MAHKDCLPIMSAKNVDKLIEQMKNKPFVTGGAFVTALRDLNRLRGVCEGVVNYHNTCQQLEEREEIGELERLLLL